MIDDVMIHKHVLELTVGVISDTIVWMDQMKMVAVSLNFVIMQFRHMLHNSPMD